MAKFSLIFSWNSETFKPQRTPESRNSALAPSNSILKSRNTTIVSRNRIKLFTRIQKNLNQSQESWNPFLCLLNLQRLVCRFYIVNGKLHMYNGGLLKVLVGNWQILGDNNRSNIWKPQVQGGQLKKQRKETKGSTRPSLRRNWRPCIGDARLKRFSKRRTVFSLIQLRCIQCVVSEQNDSLVCKGHFFILF